MDPQFSSGSHTTGPLQWLRVRGSATVIRRPTRIRVGPAVVRFVHIGTERCDCLARSVLFISTPMTARYTSAPRSVRHH